MAGDLGIVDGQIESWRGGTGGRIDEPVGPLVGDERTKHVEVVAGDIPRVGTRVGRELPLVQRLERSKGACGGQAMQLRHVLLQSGQIVQSRRHVMLAFPFDRFDMEGEVGRVRHRQRGPRGHLVFDAFAG